MDKVIDPIKDPLVERYLEHVRVEKRLAARTVTLYSLDLLKLCELTQALQLELVQVQNQHIRRWAAQMHAQGRSSRGIALILSGWRGFYAWLGREGMVSSNPVQDVKAPKSAKPLPKAMSVDDAIHFANYQSESDAPWLELRDSAMVELLYGSGLRVGELVGLDAIGAGAWRRRLCAGMSGACRCAAPSGWARRSRRACSRRSARRWRT